MGFLGDIGHATVQEKLKEGAQACKRLGKPSGIIGMNPDMAGKFVEYGFSWVAVGSDMGYVVSRGQEYLAKMRGSAPSAAAKPQSAY
jgi:2-dehydro-3-deoxyglucarate aldolase/4-hydroxy-2-oxoheptanedioate aldolase